MKKWFVVLLAAVMALTFLTAQAEETAAPAEIPAITAIRAETYVGDYGQMARAFDVTFASSVQGLSVAPSNFALENNRVHPVLSDVSSGVTSVKLFGDTMHLDVDPFLYAQGFRVSFVRDGETVFSFDASGVTEVSCAIADEFETHVTEAGLGYRLFAPASDGPLPLVVWFHGGGEGGTDNMKQLTSNRGAVCWAEPAYQAKHPAMVLAPQSNNSWSDEELDDIGDVVQQLINDGKVDASRVYAVGLAAQQATLRFCARHRDLLAAAMPIIYWKDFDVDYSVLADLPMWCSIAENDITGEAPNMLAFVDSMQNELGNDQVQCTIYPDAVMNAYGLFGGLYHWGWIPTINNADMIDWLFSNSK